MPGYILRRLAEFVPTLLGVSIVVFLIIRLVPGDPARLIAGTEASEDDIANIRQQLGLNDPLLVQYGRFLRGAVTGDFGRSLRNRQPVVSLLAAHVPATLRLAAASLLVALAIGLSTGVLAGIRHGSVLDTGSMLLALIGVSMPSFWLGLLLIYLLAVTLRWLPTSGDAGPQYLIMPALTLGTASAAIIARITRASVLETLHQDYVRTARAKGLLQHVIVTRHVLRNALIPIITVIGLHAGTLLAGSVVVETVFAWPGVGRMLVEAVLLRDYPVVQASLLLFALIAMLTSLLADIAYVVVDPRIRFA